MFASDVPTKAIEQLQRLIRSDARLPLELPAPPGDMLYHAYESHVGMLWPLHAAALTAQPGLHRARESRSKLLPVQKLAAACEVFLLLRLTHTRPDFGIQSVRVGGSDVAVREKIAARTPFATLLHFCKDCPDRGPPVLIVAPMSGHFATLLRDTVRTMLADHDVYITDWHNARDVPLIAGRFGLEEYIEHVIDFLDVIGAGAHLLAICQPCVASLAAVALMSEDGHPAVPASMTLMAGPIDCRVAPTEVNRLATERPYRWFEKNLISSVPLRHPGAMRRVYPGFVQLMAFMSMNLERHLDSFRGLYNDLVNREDERANATRAFYEEYFAVCDLPAEFYLETVKLVFQEYALAKGKLAFRGRRVDPGAIRRTALLTVEGERDDICSLGQTLAAHDLCTGLRPYMKTHFVQAGAGHYGVFSGKRWSGSIYPVVREVVHASR
jgi:polyhydroxyalkanoate depolymerase